MFVLCVNLKPKSMVPNLIIHSFCFSFSLLCTPDSCQSLQICQDHVINPTQPLLFSNYYFEKDNSFNFTINKIQWYHGLRLTRSRPMITCEIVERKNLILECVQRLVYATCFSNQRIMNNAQYQSNYDKKNQWSMIHR